MKKPNKIEAAALLVAFIVMIAALSIDNRKNPDFSMDVHGVVRDTDGNPISDAVIGFFKIGLTDDAYTITTWLRTDEQGEYSGQLSSERYGLSGTIGCVAESTMTWSQQKNITIYDGRDFEIDFVLADITYVILPTGPIVFADTIPNHTQVSVNITIGALAMFRFSTVNMCTSDGPYYAEKTITKTSSNGSMTYYGLRGYISGKYYELRDGEYDIECDTAHTVLPPASSGVRIYAEGEVDHDYLEPSDVAIDSAFYSLSFGESVTISASPDSNVTIPSGLTLDTEGEVEGLTTDLAIQCTYDIAHRYYDAYVTDNRTSVSATIAPLTSGTHQYQVYIEQGFIIHIWELTE